MRCLIVDDEPLAREEMRKLLLAHEDVQVVGEASSVAAALRLVELRQPDVVFLDVQLRGETGFDFLAQAIAPLPHIVFVTAHDRFAADAFRVDAIDYLLKPVQPAHLSEALRRVPRGVRQRSSAETIFLKIGSASRFVPWRNVLRIVSNGNYTRVHLEDGTNTVVLRTLKDWLSLLPVDLFLQVHRTTIVRRDAICEIRFSSARRGELLLSDGSILPVGRSRVPILRAALMSEV